MAPTKEKAKEKVKKATGEDAEDMVLQYLRKQNRPYSATDVSANLHNRVTKTAAAKILKDLHERKQIEGRASGKQLVYHSLQQQNDDDASTTSMPERLATAAAELASLREETAALRAKAGPLRAEVAALGGVLTVAELRDAVVKMEAERRGALERLGVLRGESSNAAPAPVVDEEERARAEAEVRKWAGVERKRRAIRKEMWAICREGAEMAGRSVEALKEELGITDA